MFLNPYRRTRWNQIFRVAIFLLPAILLLDILLILGQHRSFRQNLRAQNVVSLEDLPHIVQRQQVFITAQFWSSERLLTDHWIDAFLRLVHILGPKNIYVSILSNHGLDNTEDAVRQLDAQLAELGVSRTITLDPMTHEDAISTGPEDAHGNPRPGWVITDDASESAAKERRRIPYLSELRNRCLEPLQDLQRNSSRTFDRILYLNDVVFEPKDILTLLATNGGDFDVACGLDYHLPPALYDTFVVRDLSFRGPITSVFPFFVNSVTRDAMLAGLPTPVTSCWNGVIAVDAAPYYSRPIKGHPGEMQKGLQFRAIPDSLAEYYVEASECCLIHADLLASGQAHRGMYLNPAVRTAYVAEAYEETHRGAQGVDFISAWQYWSGIWVIRFRRWWKDAVSISAGQNMEEVYRRIKLWEREQQAKESPQREVGEYCTVLEMQILMSNGWKHVKKDFGKEKLKGSSLVK